MIIQMGINPDIFTHSFSLVFTVLEIQHKNSERRGQVSDPATYKHADALTS